MTADTIRKSAADVMDRGLAPVRALNDRSPAPLWPVILGLIVVSYPFVVDDRYWIRVGATVALYVILAVGLNMIAGFAGMLDMGFVAFYAIGAYTYALLNSPQFDVHLGFWWSLPIAMGVTTVIGILVGIPSLRVRGDYLAIVTLAFFSITRLLIINLDRGALGNVTNGPNGIPAVSRPSVLGMQFTSAPRPYYFLIWGVALLVVFLAVRLQFSRTGRAWAGIRDDEITASCMGVNLPRYRVLAFASSAALAGLGGALIAAWQAGVYPENFSILELVAIYLVLILGGSGNPVGVIVGAVVYTFPGEYMRSFESLTQWRTAIFSILLLLVIIFRPQGVLPARPRKSKTEVDEVTGAAAEAAPADQTPTLSGSMGSPTPALAGGVVRMAGVARAPADLLEAAVETASSVVGRGPADTRAPADAQIGALLEVQGLSKSFGGVSAVENVSFTVNRGEILGVIGPNGAGKTTLFNLITGIYKPDAGTVTFRGEDITGLTPDRIARRGLGRTFQNIRIFPLLSVLDNVMTGAHPRLKAGVFRSMLRPPSVRREESLVEREALANLAFFGRGVAERKDSYVTTLNYADRRRVEIARAMALAPDLLLLDEPAAGMNPAEVGEITEQIRQLRDRGFTIILVEHQMPVVMGVSDRILVVNKGQVLCEGTPAFVRQNEEVIKAYLGEEQEECVITPKPSLASGQPMLQMKGVEASYGPIKVLKGLDIEVYPGEIVCLLGANAAGKSTTMKTVLGNVRASAGTIEFDGKRIDRWRTPQIVEAGVSLVPEGRRVFPRLTVLDNLKMGGYTVSDANVIREGVELAFEQFPILYERRDQKAGTLSGGEQQMLAIGRALMTKPRLLCLDEPSMGLSPILVQQVFEIIQKINEDLNTTIFMVEQNATLALRIAHRGYVLQTGRIVAADEACNLVGDEAIKEAYLGG
jgi:branched-chain amino acid transport system ATP-binding protein